MEETMVEDVAELLKVAQLRGQIATTQFVIDRLSTYMREHPMTIDLLPSDFRDFLIRLCMDMELRCDGT